MRFNEKVLMFESCGDSPWVAVRSVTDVAITRGSDGDAIDLEVIPSEGQAMNHRVVFGDPLPVVIKAARVRARRVAGEGPVTVIMFQE